MPRGAPESLMWTLARSTNGNASKGNAVLPGIIADACDAANVPWGHVSSGCIYTGSRPDSSGFTEDDAPNSTFRQNNSSFYGRSKARGEEVLASIRTFTSGGLRIPFRQFNHPRNHLTKVIVTRASSMELVPFRNFKNSWRRACSAGAAHPVRNFII